MNVLRHLLVERGIEALEAGGSLAPGQNAFCAKICSKIITSQFCIILLNNDVQDGTEIPNANVNMEYGLMLGFNKYVVPFQRETQTLPFNVSGLDTVKYSNLDFESRARKAIDVAIQATVQDAPPAITPDQILEAFLLSQQVMIVPPDTDGDRDLYRFGQPLGFILLSTFDGMKYRYFGNFTTLRAEAAAWRVRTLANILKARIDSIPQRVQLGLVNPAQLTAFQTFIESLDIWVFVTSDEERDTLRSLFRTEGLRAKALAVSDVLGAFGRT